MLVTRARRNERSPTVASRFWLRLEAMTGGITRETRLERLVAVLDDPGAAEPVSQATATSVTGAKATANIGDFRRQAQG